MKKYCPRWGSNSRPSDYETDALPTALRRHCRDVVFSKINTYFMLIYWVEKAFKQFIDNNNNYNFDLKNEKKSQCVSRESNPGQLLGRQLCSPLYHWRLIYSGVGAEKVKKKTSKQMPNLCSSYQPKIQSLDNKFAFYKKKVTAVTRIRTWVTAATTQGPNH